MRRSFFRCVLSVSLFMTLMCCNSFTVWASQQIIEADGYYTAGDGLDESFAIARERAKSQAMRNASEQACVFVESISEGNKGVLSKDEIRTISANILQVQGEPHYTTEIVGENVIRFHCHVTAMVDSSNVIEALQRDKRALDEAVRRNKEMEAELARINRENEELKKRYATATSESQKQKIREESQVNSDDFQAAMFLEIGNQMSHKDNFPLAIENYQKALSINTKSIAAWNGLGNAYLKMNNNAKAKECFEKILAMDSRNSDAWEGLGEVYDKANEIVKAKECYEKSLDIDSTNGAAWLGLGMVYYDGNDKLKARECLEKLVVIEPDIEECWHLLGLINHELKDYVKAIDYYTKAVMLNPKYADVYNDRGVAYEELKQYKKAKADFNKAYELSPGNKLIAYNKKRSENW